MPFCPLVHSKKSQDYITTLMINENSVHEENTMKPMQLGSTELLTQIGREHV